MKNLKMKLKQIIKEESANFLGMTLGSFLAALSLVLFLIPNKIAAGGISGLAIIIYHLAGLPVGLVMVILNIPLLIMGFREFGLRFGVRALYGLLTIALFIDLLGPFVAALTDDTLLASIYGGALAGLGMGIVFRFYGSLGGTDMAAQLLRRHTRLTSGQSLLVIDAFVITLAGTVFGAEMALYALVSLVLLTRVIDVVQEGVSYDRVALVVSDRSPEIVEEIMKQLKRGATILEGKGGYSRSYREVLLCAVNRTQVSHLKSLIADIDPRAFVLVVAAHEVLGEGFKSFPRRINT